MNYKTNSANNERGFFQNSSPRNEHQSAFCNGFQGCTTDPDLKSRRDPKWERQSRSPNSAKSKAQVPVYPTANSGCRELRRSVRGFQGLSYKPWLEKVRAVAIRRIDELGEFYD